MTHDDDARRAELSPENAHPDARNVLSDPFFWNASDPCGPFGSETGLDVLDALRDFRDEHPSSDALVLLDALLVRWEVTNDAWDTIAEDDVQALGEADEFSLLTRDETILALAFAEIVVDGRVEPEVRRRALLALRRQALPALLHGWGERMHARADRLERMTAVLTRPRG